MNDFDGLLASDFGLKPQGKSAPMAPSKGTSNISHSSLNFDYGLGGASGSTRASNPLAGSVSDDRESKFGSKGYRKNRDFDGLDDLLGGSERQDRKSDSPVYDKPVFDDDDIFEGMPGFQNSTKGKYDDVFSSFSSPRKNGNEAFDDILAGFGKAKLMSDRTSEKKNDMDLPAFDDLIPGFGSGNSSGDRSTSEAEWSEPTTAKRNSKLVENPFDLSGQYTDPLEEISKFKTSRSSKADSTSASNGRRFDDMDPFAGLGKYVPSFSSDGNNNSRNPLRGDVRSPKHHLQKDVSVDSERQSAEILFDMPSVSTNSSNFVHRSASPYASTSSKDANMQGFKSPPSQENFGSSGDVWLTVLDIPLVTHPTNAPPPSRPPPPVPVKVSKATMERKKVNSDYSFSNSTQHFQTPKSASAVSPMDELEDFAMGRKQNNVGKDASSLHSEELEINSVAAAAAAMKEAMYRAEAKFRHAKEVREREGVKVTRSKYAVHLDKVDQTMQDERAEKDKDEEEREKRRLEGERERAREREEKEREQRRLEKDKERAREIEREREKARQAVERATREARERAAAEARLRAEKAAVEKASLEARERAERAAVQQAQSEARVRAAAQARERAEKAAAEARKRERENAEAKEREVREIASAARARVERAAVEKSAAEARERAAADARERAAAAAREKQHTNENDLESFFGAGARASSAPRHRANSADPFFDSQSKNRQEPEVARTSSGTSSSMRKASSSSSVVDDLSSIFGAAPSLGGFQEVEGETEERRRARLERHQRTEERAAKALAEKNQRDLQTQREQDERHRIAETLDVELKRWAAGKEGNLRALLSSLHYVIWPECGWQPVSLTDMITAAQVKKVYRKATLCIHPDKVQQKGATLQQKYIAEKVFDILKEAWNKFNSEELF